MMDMVEQSGSKSNTWMFDHNEGHSALPQPATDTPTLQQRYAQVQLPMASSRLLVNLKCSRQVLLVVHVFHAGQRDWL